MKNKGFTLIELLLTIIVVAIISGVSAQVLVRGIEIYSLIANRRDALEHARVGMDRMVSELLLVKSLDITSISNTNISFKDINGSSTSFRRATQYNTIDLFRGSDFLAGQVALLDFDYYKSDGSPANFTWDVRRINIELTIQTIGGYGDVPLRTEVFPRNFMYTNFR
ncbi:MAG: hypothetical protein COV46_02745 [Deltaproteobacteria bacterium CG11_big_fil_rev_8_21_14_0_20_49_13]|nr:MAG: hypothetical protein COV46_02745 [Deltaproteobacteria bacterium CG11_big_fil_rev_8_21_14_0_20_49_13]